MSFAGQRLRLVLAPILAALALAMTGAAGALVDAPPITIGTVTVEDGTAVIEGVVDAGADLELNGVPVDVGQTGEFVAVADLDADALVFVLLEDGGNRVEIRVPVDVLLSSGDAALQDLVDAGIEIDVPADGFQVVDGQMPLVEGRVLNDSTLSLLEVNGVDVLSRIGRDGFFSVVVPGSTSTQREHVTVVAQGRNGATQTNRYATRTIRSTIATRAGTSVSAAGAQGLVIAKVRLDTRRLAGTKRLGVIVTVKDRRGYLVRGAALRLAAGPKRHLATGWLRAGFTNRLGQARFTYRLRPTALAASKQFLTIATRATTARDTASLRVKLRLPASTG